MLGENIKKMRKKNNITQKELAEFMNLTQNAISNWENNINEPSEKQIRMMCEKYNTTPNELYGIDSKIENNIWNEYFGDVTLEEFEFLMNELNKYRANKK